MRICVLATLPKIPVKVRLFVPLRMTPVPTVMLMVLVPVTVLSALTMTEPPFKAMVEPVPPKAPVLSTIKVPRVTVVAPVYIFGKAPLRVRLPRERSG